MPIPKIDIDSDGDLIFQDTHTSLKKLSQLGGGGGGPPVWGDITGTLVNQTDLSGALNGKSDSGHGHSQLHSNINDHAVGSDNQDLSGKVDKVTGSSLVMDSEISKIHTSGSDNQDLSGLEPKQTGKSLSTNDYDDAAESKLAGIETGANNYTHPANHSPSIITQDASNRFVSDTEKGTWNGKEPGNANIQTHVTSAHAPSNAQANADITKAEIEAKLTGTISSHSHTGGSGDVLGPATNNADYLPQWNGANSKTLKDGLAVPAGGLAGITALNLKAPTADPTFTGVPAAPTAAAGTNTTQLATTAFATAINNNASYRTIKSGAGSHIAAKVAGNYVFPPGGGVMAVGGTGTLYPQQVFYLTAADYPTINGITTKLRITGSVHCNDVAPFTGTFTFGLHPITRPATSGGAGLCIYTVGTVVSGSNGAVVTNAAADSSNNAIGADFAFPANGWYGLVCVTSATMATSAHTHITCELQMRNN